MKKPIEVGQRVAVYESGEFVCRGNVVQTPGDGEVAFAVKDAKGTYYYCYWENLRILKPKPKRICHCNREPDRWAAFNAAGGFVCSSPTRKSIMEWVTLDACKYIAPLWIGPKEEV